MIILMESIFRLVFSKLGSFFVGMGTYPWEIQLGRRLRMDPFETHRLPVDPIL